MKKHIFAFICIFILMFNTFTYKDTKAMDIGVAIDVGSEILYEGWDMIQSIFNGFVISLGQYAGYADKASAMAAFYNDWGDVLTVLTGGYLSPTEVEQSAIGVNTVMPRDFGMTGAVMRDFIFNYGGFVGDPNLGMYADVNMNSLASWNRYNDLYVQQFLDAHNKDIEEHPTYPDLQYSAQLNRINLRDSSDNTAFWFYNIPNYQPNATNNLHFDTYPCSNYSWITYNNYSFPSSVGALQTPYLFPDDIITININSDVSGYSYSVSGTSEGMFFTNNTNRFWQYGYFDNSNGLIISGLGNSYTNPPGISYSYSQSNVSLQTCLNHIASHFKNVNIYVDGILWAYVGQVQEPNVELGIDHPRYDENGQMIGNDVFFPEQDLKADLVKFTELIDDKILTGDSIDLDDLIDAGVLTDADGNIITDENRDEYIKTRDISSVITDALDDTDVVDLLPDAPDPPPYDPWNWKFPTIVIPDGGDPEPRKTGLSVLARIVNVTNQSLPGEVITMFWGICITMLILGIIKILHK